MRTAPETCARKVQYLTSSDALKALEEARAGLRARGQAPHSLTAYRCDCAAVEPRPHFHLGNHPALVA